MTVDFNNLRRQACNAHDKLVKILNGAICSEANGDWVDGYGRVCKNTIIIEPEQLEDVMNDLRMMIGSIASCFDKEGDVANVYEELYPEGDETKRMALFNPEP